MVATDKTEKIQKEINIMRIKKEKRFFHIIEQLSEKPCWAVTAGPGTGTVISIDLGKKIARDNPRGTSEVARFDGEFTVFVEDASWRLDTPDRVICTSTDSNHRGGVMVRGLKRLEGTVVTSAEIFKPAYDLRLGFSNGCFLTVFCCSSNEVDLADNYSVITRPRQGAFVVGVRSVLTYEDYSQLESDEVQ